MSDMEDRVERAVSLFKEGYNCSQSVCAAFADMYGYAFEQSLTLSASFGGGIGRMRQTCGAACGMFILAGMHTGTSDPKDNKAKGDNYKLVQQLASEFQQRNGSLICAELLGLADAKHDNTTPEQRTDKYYKKRPCVKMVEAAARIWSDYLEAESLK